MATPHTHPLMDRSIEYTKRWELCMLKSYLDKDGTWHIGYGHGNAMGTPPFVDEFTTLKDEAEAFAILVNDMAYLDPIMEKMLKSIDHNDNEYASLKDIAYNRGPGTLRNSAVIHYLKQPELKNYRKLACRYIVHHHEDPKFTTLDTSTDPETGEQRVYLGLELRRIDNASQFQLPMETK